LIKGTGRVLVMANTARVFMDHVYCNNCEVEMLVDHGEDICPNCGSEGNMADIQQSIENPFPYANLFGKYVTLPDC